MSSRGSRVIKRGIRAPEPHQPDAGDLLASARTRAREIVCAAEADAAEVRRGAVEELRLAMLDAGARGHAEGMARAAAALALAAQAREALLAELDAEVVEVALEVARRVVGRELAARPDSVTDMARRALRAAAGTGGIVLRVAAEDLEAVTSAEGVLRSLVERGSLGIAADPALLRGEVIVESTGGRVDARIAAQLDPFRRALLAEEP